MLHLNIIGAWREENQLRYLLQGKLVEEERLWSLAQERIGHHLGKKSGVVNPEKKKKNNYVPCPREW